MSKRLSAGWVGPRTLIPEFDLVAVLVDARLFG